MEPDESFGLELGAPSVAGVTVPDDTALGTIRNDDAASIAIDDVSQAEGDTDTTFRFTVTLDGDVADGFTVGYSTLDGTATGSDFTAASGTLSFAGSDGESRTIDITVHGDAVVENDETFFVLLGTPSEPGVTATDGRGLGTIENDDSASLSIDDVARDETDDGTVFPFTVTLTGEVDRGFIVTYATVAGTAAAGSDYAATAAILTFSGADGEIRTIEVDIEGDTVVEADENFTVELGAPSEPNVTVTDASGLGTIRNDDSASVAIDDVGQVETDSGTTFAFSVTLSGDVAGGFSLPFATADGTATEADGDYAGSSGNLTFSGTDGEIRTIEVEVTGDTVVEADETFTVEFGAPSEPSVTASDASGLGTIRNDDSASVAIDDVGQVETDSGTT
ncbi:MAG: hypothetical protein MI919_31640, partial [Holophagales bacterium]|nr:hypothetical protein [Holophagales bacterium]